MGAIMKINFLKLNKKAITPAYGSEFSAGADLYALVESSVSIRPGETYMVHTGIAMEIPEGYVGLVFARSGLASKKGLAPANKVGVIDSDYRGEIMIPLLNHSDSVHTVANGERVAQIVLVPYLKADFCEARDLTETGRGTKGFGSTGSK